jgi:hypothetical protein
LLEATLVRQSNISNRPEKPEMDPEAPYRSTNVELPKRLKNSILIIVEKLVKNKVEFDYNLFTLVLQNLCISVTCTSIKVLRVVFAKLQQLIEEDALNDLFRVYSDRMIEQFLRRRTGILSPDLNVRRLAQNVLICLGWAG